MANAVKIKAFHIYLQKQKSRLNLRILECKNIVQMTKKKTKK